MRLISVKWLGRVGQLMAISALFAVMALLTACETVAPGQGRGLYAEVYETRRAVSDMKTDQGDSLRRINDLLVEMDKKLNEQDKILRESKDDLQRQIRDLQEGQKSRTSSPMGQTTDSGLNQIPGPPSGQEEQQLFDSAQADMQSRTYDAAIQKLNQFLSNYPASPKAAEALYQLGKANYEKGQYEEASKSFERIRTQYPAATTVIPLAMHAQALAEYKMQQNATARATLEQLKQTYPEYEPRRVDDMLRQIPNQ